jgi:hypothetical protein
MSILDKIDAQMNYIISLIKQMPKSSRKILNKSLTKNSTSSSLLFLPKNKNLLSTSMNNNQRKDLSTKSCLELTDNPSNLITSENFPFSHLCNRDVDKICFPFY